MENSFNEIIKKICSDNGLDYEKTLKDNQKQIQNFLEVYEDPDIHLRCKGKNKNNKRCSKNKKDNSDYCSVHITQQKEKDSEYISSEKFEKSDEKSDDVSEKSSIQILDVKKKGILPEKIKKITHESKKYYINKNEWVYEMDQSNEVILSDIPIGRFFSGKLVFLKIDDI